MPGAALVVLTSVTGGTLRERGAMMCVTTERVSGYISNGCVDADIIARARAGQSGTFIYGEGSPYRDIVLPCGGRLELSIFQKGRGAACVALSELAQLSGFDVVLQSPDVDGLPKAQHLIDPNNPPHTEDDAWTAVVCLFHDHDWEPTLLRQALDGEAFYIGAMGSERTLLAVSILAEIIQFAQRAELL